MEDRNATSKRQELAKQITKARDILSKSESTIGAGGYAGYCGQLEASLELLADAAEDAMADMSGVAQHGGGWISGSAADLGKSPVSIIGIPQLIAGVGEVEPMSWRLGALPL